MHSLDSTSHPRLLSRLRLLRMRLDQSTMLSEVPLW
jgi:hypothetical protein